MSFRKSPYIATCIVIACCLFSMHGFAMLQNHKVKRNKQAHAERVTDANSLSSKILDTTAKAVKFRDTTIQFGKDSVGSKNVNDSLGRDSL
ncbi:MAG: hypothetical protein WCS05_04330, partial [Bacteroidales bacterium]